MSVQRALQQQEGLITEAVEEVRQRFARQDTKFTVATLVELAEDQMLVAMAQQITWRIRGRVALYVCPSDDEERIVRKARNLVFAADRSSIAQSRLFISIPATWEGIQAAKKLKALGIEASMTQVCTVAQAMACAQAQVAQISVPITAIHRWNQSHNDSPFYDGENIQNHMGIIFVKRMAQIFARHRYATQILPCDFTTVEEVMMLAGLPMVCLPMEIIQQLNKRHGVAVNTMDQVRGIILHRDVNSVSATSPGYSDKASFQEALQAEPADIYNLVGELLQETCGLMDWMRAVVDSHVRSYPKLQQLLVYDRGIIV